MTVLDQAVQRLTRRLAPQRIAVIDDDERDRDLVEALLAGREVRMFARPEEFAAAVVRGWEPDVLLLDVHMPGVRHELWLPRLSPLVARIVVFSDAMGHDVPECLRALPRLRKIDVARGIDPRIAIDATCRGALAKVRDDLVA